MSRKTDFFYECYPGDKMGFPPGYNKQLVRWFRCRSLKLWITIKRNIIKKYHPSHLNNLTDLPSKLNKLQLSIKKIQKLSKKQFKRWPSLKQRHKLLRRYKRKRKRKRKRNRKSQKKSRKFNRKLNQFSAVITVEVTKNTLGVNKSERLK